MHKKPEHEKIAHPYIHSQEEIELLMLNSENAYLQPEITSTLPLKGEIEVQQIQQASKPKPSVPIPAKRQSSIYKNAVLIKMDQKDQQLSQMNAQRIPSKLQITPLESFKYNSKDWHLFKESVILQLLSTQKHGLTTEEAMKRFNLFGENSITPPKKQHWFLKFCKALVGGFQSMMIIGSILCFIVYGISGVEDVQTLALALVLIIVVLITTIFQQYQEGKSEQTMDALKALAPQNCMVERDGQVSVLPTAELTIGDIVHVKSGDKVPADVRVLEASDLKVNNAALTGENIDIKLGTEANHQDLYEAKNVARSGCNFTSGTGICVVYAIGDNTFFGEISKNTTQIKRPETLIKKEIERLIKFMGAFAIILGIGFLIAALVIGYSLIDAIVFVIGIIIANVPEGLLPQMTVALTITAQRMLKIGVLVQNLDIIETLGAVTVICSDKTGTLTCNRMSVSHLVYNMEIFNTPLAPVQASDKFRFYDRLEKNFLELVKSTILNTDAIFLNFDQDVLKRETKGDASESAIIKFLEPMESVEKYRKSVKRVAAIPFNSTNKWMMTVCENEGPESDKFPYTMYVKGAPEKIFMMCTNVLKNNIVEAMDELQLEKLSLINEILAKRGERVLAFSKLDLPADQFPKGFKFDTDDGETQNIFPKDLTFVGLYSLIDPPRMSVKPAIKQCNKAGVQVFMVTGDHPITAHAIAKSLDLITGPTQDEVDCGEDEEPEKGVYSIVVHGSEITHFKEQDWTRVLAHKEIVFARTMPSQKQLIVQELSKLGHILAMTGDGVNDAPALKAAHVGIAMGSGSAVAKEAGSIILLNDDFGNIVEGIQEGRLIFENLKKCIAYVLISNVPEIVPFLLFIILKIPIAIETIVILLIDIGTDLVPTVCLAYEDSEDIIMEVPPRSKDNHLISASMMGVCYGFLGMFETIAAFFAFYWTFADYGLSFDDLLGQGIGFRTPYADLDPQEQNLFTNLCKENEYYQANFAQNNCEDNFDKFRSTALGQAQAAFFLTIIWGQFANLLSRKTQLQSIFTVKRFFGNIQLFYGILSEIFVFLFFVYIPDINSAFLLVMPTSTQATCGMWVFPFILIWEETRKLIIRHNKGGFIDRLTRF